jgi:hypothetical protein
VSTIFLFQSNTLGVGYCKTSEIFGNRFGWIYEWAISFFELLDVLCFVRNGAVFPELEHNADPFECDCSDGGERIRTDDSLLRFGRQLVKAGDGCIFVAGLNVASSVDGDEPTFASFREARFGHLSLEKTSILGVIETIPSKPEGLLLSSGECIFLCIGAVTLFGYLSQATCRTTPIIFTTKVALPRDARSAAAR